MKILDAALRLYAYLYHLLMAAFLGGLALVAYLTGVHNINSAGMNNLRGETLTQCLAGIAVTGILSVVLAATGIFRFLFPIYAVGAAFTIFRWFFASGYSFRDQGAFAWGVWLFLGALGAMLASFLELKRGVAKRR